jgi:hypothetical protein
LAALGAAGDVLNAAHAKGLDREREMGTRRPVLAAPIRPEPGAAARVASVVRMHALPRREHPRICAVIRGRPELRLASLRWSECMHCRGASIRASAP